MVPDLRAPGTKAQTRPYCHRLKVAVPGNKDSAGNNEKCFCLQLAVFQVAEVIHGPSAAAH